MNFTAPQAKTSSRINPKAVDGQRAIGAYRPVKSSEKTTSLSKKKRPKGYPVGRFSCQLVRG